MQYTNIIAVDPSITCTGLCINNQPSCFVAHDTAYTKKGSLKKWFSFIDEHDFNINTFSDLDEMVDGATFTDSEVYKLKKYDKYTDDIVKYIVENSDVGRGMCIIEGYSYSSNAGHIIDLVTFSTLLRTKLLHNNFDIMVVPPSTLKISSAKLTYEPEVSGKTKKRYTWRNRDGVAGGSFTKTDMFKSIIDNESLVDAWATLLKKESGMLLSGAKIPTPVDDMNDAYLLYHTYINNILE